MKEPKKIIYFFACCVFGVLIGQLGCDSREDAQQEQEDEEAGSPAYPQNLKEFLTVYGDELKTWGVNIRLEGDVLVTQTNAHYPIMQYASQFHRDLFLEVKDIERAKIVWKAYNEHLALLPLSVKQREGIEWWILTYNRFFIASENGVEKSIVDYEKKLSLYGSFSVFHGDGVFASDFKAFMNDVLVGYHGLIKNNTPPSPTKIKSIAVISGPYGGGHIATANALKNALEKKYNIELIDECEYSENAIKIATNNTYNWCTIYNVVEMKEGNWKKASILYHLNWLLMHYIAPDIRGELRRKLDNEDVDLLISAIHHINDVTSVAYALTKPVLISITDYGFPKAQWWDMDHVSPDLTRYLIPEEGRNLFREMMIKYHDHPRRWNARVPTSRVHYLYQNMFASAGPQLPKLTEQMLQDLDIFEILGFPVNSDITYARNKEDIDSAKKALYFNLDENRKIVTIGFGASADVKRVSALLEQVIRLQSLFEFNVQLGLITGGNSVLKSTLEKLLESNKIPIIREEADLKRVYLDKLVARVFDRLDAASMGNLYRASDVFISKAGGSTTAELLASSTYYLRGFAIASWEYENALKLEAVGLSVKDTDNASSTSVNYKILSEEPEVNNLIVEVNTLLKRPKIFSKINNYIPFSEAILLQIVKNAFTRHQAAWERMD